MFLFVNHSWRAELGFSQETAAHSVYERAGGWVQGSWGRSGLGYPESLKDQSRVPCRCRLWLLHVLRESIAFRRKPRRTTSTCRRRRHLHGTHRPWQLVLVRPPPSQLRCATSPAGAGEANEKAARLACGLRGVVVVAGQVDCDSADSSSDSSLLSAFSVSGGAT